MRCGAASERRVFRDSLSFRRSPLVREPPLLHSAKFNSLDPNEFIIDL